jgi:hypothetical protein
MRRRVLLGAVLAALLSGASPRALAQVAANGFLVRHQAAISAPPSKVYEVLVRQVGSWWNPEHTYSGDAGNLSIDPRPGDCFARSWHGGEAVVETVLGEQLRRLKLFIETGKPA